MPWHYYVMNIAAKANPPKEWENIWKCLKEKNIIPDDYINKIEVCAFGIPGKRTARWKIKPNDKNYKYYSTKQNALDVARKLTWLILKSENAPAMPPNLRILLNKSGKFPDEPSVCPLCRRKLDFSEFKLFGRKDPNSIQMGHLTPLSRLRIGRGHEAQNIIWIHRRCNDIQDEQTVFETIQILRQILERHGYKISSKS